MAQTLAGTNLLPLMVGPVSTSCSRSSHCGMTATATIADACMMHIWTACCMCNHLSPCLLTICWKCASRHKAEVLLDAASIVLACEALAVHTSE